MAKTRTVSKGQTLVAIVGEEGFRSWDTVWNDPGNAALAAQRRPGQLHVGDVLVIPDLQTKSVERPAFAPGEDPGRTYGFKVKGRPFKSYVSIVLHDEEGSSFPNHGYELRVDGRTYRGTTDANGRLVQEVPRGARRCQVTLWSDADGSEASWTLAIGAHEPA